MELSEIREQIDRIDEELLRLFLERMDLSEEIARYKSARGLPSLDREREREILTRATSAAGDRARYVYRLFATVMELSRERQAEIKEEV